MLYPIGTLVDIKKNSEKRVGVIVGLYTKRQNPYTVILVTMDQQTKKLGPVKGEDLVYTDGSDFVGLNNIWSLGSGAVESIIKGAGIEPQNFFEMMSEENA